MKNITLLAIIAAVTFTTACSNSKKNTTAIKASGEMGTAITDQMKLNGSWRLTDIKNPTLTFAGLFPDKKPTLVFKLSENQISGNGGCNGYGGQVNIEGHNIKFSKIIHTMMACDGINGENQYFKTLEEVTTYKLTSDTSLILSKGDVAMMNFIKQ